MFTIAFVNPDSNYANNLIGLLGNENGIMTDDIFSRTTNAVQTDLIDSSIYNTAITCKNKLKKTMKLAD